MTLIPFSKQGYKHLPALDVKPVLTPLCLQRFQHVICIFKLKCALAVYGADFFPFR